MKTFVLVTLLTFLPAASGVVAAPSNTVAMQPGDVQAIGVIVAIDPARGHLTIRHEPIASINWPEMTMTLNVASTDLLKRVKVGEKVNFTLHQPDIADIITAITPVRS